MQKSSSDKDLAILMDDKLIFNNQIESAVNKANGKLIMTSRSFEHPDGDMLIYLYKSIIRPDVEYCNSVWPPIYKKDTQLFEGVQIRTQD